MRQEHWPTEIPPRGAQPIQLILPSEAGSAFGPVNEVQFLLPVSLMVGDQALRELCCGRCGSPIAAGDGFTRGRLWGGLLPICEGCRPLEAYRHNRWGPASKREPPANVRSFREERKE